MTFGRQRRLDSLIEVPLFSLCSRAELRAIDQCATRRTVAPGRALVQEGQLGKEFFVVLAGRGEVRRNDRVVDAVGPGSWFGELALLDPAPRNASVIATTEMELLVLSHGGFATVLIEAPSMTRKLLKGMARRLRELDLQSGGVPGL